MCWSNLSHSVNDSSLPWIFSPFGSDEGDSVVTVGDYTCDGPINIPYRIFNHNTLYVSSTCAKRNKVTSSFYSVAL